jgi:hypothetical protein
VAPFPSLALTVRCKYENVPESPKAVIQPWPKPAKVEAALMSCWWSCTGIITWIIFESLSLDFLMFTLLKSVI